jgi:hypothetical protein
MNRKKRVRKSGKRDKRTPRGSRGQGHNGHREPERTDFGIVTFEQILRLTAPTLLGAFDSPKYVRFRRGPEEGPPDPDPAEEALEDDGAGTGDRAGPDTDGARDTTAAHGPGYEGTEINSIGVPEGTKGRYTTVVSEEGHFLILLYKVRPDWSNSGIVQEGATTVTVDETIPQERIPLRLPLDPELLEDLMNATWHLGLNLQGVLEAAARLELAKLELLHNEGNPFPPRPRHDSDETS